MDAGNFYPVKYKMKVYEDEKPKSPPKPEPEVEVPELAFKLVEVEYLMRGSPQPPNVDQIVRKMYGEF